MNQANSLIKDTAIIGFGNLFSKGIIFFLIPLQTSVMSKSDYGIAEMLFNLVNILIPIFTLGIAEAGMRFSIDRIDQRKKIFFIITWIPIIGGVVLTLCTFLFAVYFEKYTNYFLDLLLLYFCFSIREIYLQYSKGIGNLKLFSLGSIFFSVSLILLSYYYLVIEKLSVNGYLYSYIIANFTTIVFLLYFGKFAQCNIFSLKMYDEELLKDMLIYSLPLVSNVLAWWITIISNRYVIGYYCSLDDVGIYSALAKFSLIITTIYGVFFQSWQITAAKNINMLKRDVLFYNVHNYFLMAVVFGSAVIMAGSDFIASIFINVNFSEAYTYLPGIVLAGTASCLPMYWGAIYVALKDTKGAFYSTVCGSLGSIVFNFLLIPKYGIYGAIISTIISYLMVTIYRIVEINSVIKIKLDLSKHLSGFFVLLGQAIGTDYLVNTVEIVLLNFGVCILLGFIYKKLIIEMYRLIENHYCGRLLLWKH